MKILGKRFQAEEKLLLRSYGEKELGLYRD